MPQQDAAPRGRDDLVSQPTGDETLLYDPVEDAVHLLNPAAHLVWEMCDGTHTAAEMAAALRARFSGTQGHDLLAEVEETLGRFWTAGLLVRPPDEAPG